MAIGGPGRGFLVEIVNSGIEVELAADPGVTERARPPAVPIVPRVADGFSGYTMGTAIMGGRVMGAEEDDG